MFWFDSQERKTSFKNLQFTRSSFDQLLMASVSIFRCHVISLSYHTLAILQLPALIPTLSGLADGFRGFDSLLQW